MCCFSGAVKDVGSTKIFARFLDALNQCIIYEMTMSADEDVAMILPIPVVQPADEKAVKFHNLSNYPAFFEDLEKAFPIPRSFGGDGPVAAGRLEVQKVGAFDASFVPTIADFKRLDARFRLDDAVWKSLPQYEKFGFAVFKLRKGEKRKIHPMAFQFPSAMPNRIFFPTVHIHDGQVHETEEFDHTLYAQAWNNAVIKGTDWEESPKIVGRNVNHNFTGDLVWGGGHVYKKNIRGNAKNEDILAVARKLG